MCDRKTGHTVSFGAARCWIAVRGLSLGVVRESGVVMVAIARGAIAVTAAIVVGGCGGSKEHRFALADATRIANVRPAAPGWIWPQNPEKPSSAPLTEA